MRAYDLAKAMGTSTPPVRSLLANLGIATKSASSNVDVNELPPLFLVTMREMLQDTLHPVLRTSALHIVKDKK